MLLSTKISLRRQHESRRVLVPTFAIEPLLQRLELNLGISLEFCQMRFCPAAGVASKSFWSECVIYNRFHKHCVSNHPLNGLSRQKLDKKLRELLKICGKWLAGWVSNGVTASHNYPSTARWTPRAGEEQTAQAEEHVARITRKPKVNSRSAKRRMRRRLLRFCDAAIFRSHRKRSARSTATMGWWRRSAKILLTEADHQFPTLLSSFRLYCYFYSCSRGFCAITRR